MNSAKSLMHLYNRLITGLCHQGQSPATELLEGIASDCADEGSEGSRLRDSDMHGNAGSCEVVECSSCKHLLLVADEAKGWHIFMPLDSRTDAYPFPDRALGLDHQPHITPPAAYRMSYAVSAFAPAVSVNCQYGANAKQGYCSNVCHRRVAV